MIDKNLTAASTVKNEDLTQRTWPTEELEDVMRASRTTAASNALTSRPSAGRAQASPGKSVLQMTACRSALDKSGRCAREWTYYRVSGRTDSGTVQPLHLAMRAFGWKHLAAWLTFACGLAAGQTAHANPAAPVKPDDAGTQAAETISFALADEQLPSGKFTLSNGIQVNPSDWPALVFATFGENSCSGALIGPNILLTAAHCVEDKQGKLRDAMLERHGKRFPMICERHPTYVRRKPIRDASSPRGAEDYALCIIDYRGDVPKAIADMHFEVLDTSSTLVRRSAVLLTGYGCVDVRIVNSKVVSTASADILRIGDASIARPPKRGLSDGAYALIESTGKPTPALCPGDSGGPMFVGVSALKPAAPRRIAGVNSAIAPGASGRADHIVSKIAATGTTAFREWIQEWQRRNAHQALIVCGVTRDAGTFPCRS